MKFPTIRVMVLHVELNMARRVSSGTRGQGTPPTYPGTYSGYGSTRADSIGQPISTYAFQSAQQNRAYTAKQATQSTMLGKVDQV